MSAPKGTLPCLDDGGTDATTHAVSGHLLRTPVELADPAIGDGAPRAAGYGERMKARYFA
jgi:hypothetical protein